MNDPGNLNAEQLVLHVTNYHSACIINKFREVLITQKDFLEENGLHLAEAEAPVKLEDGENGNYNIKEGENINILI
ncbi:hypothetical protein HPULCUR_005827 [Helicostylum pulchrum]|uniref:Uncharacterized protein n=1 Tax=Helicostylum pulchrum TaxID=562976 RepID=A0ABP9Y060_9FUNG